MTGADYRLLSEAEWEYCCRAGTDTEYHTGDAITKSQARFNADRTTTVGHYAPNAFGMYDMHGNVYQWCSDHWHDTYDGAPLSGSPWLANGIRDRIVRGGSFLDEEDEKGRPWYLRSRVRWGEQPEARKNYVGFRVARDL